MAIPLLVAFPRVISVNWGQKKTLLLVHPFKECRIRFINSVTKRPVVISFRPIYYFGNFKMLTDKDTEDYYTSGSYPISFEFLKKEKRSFTSCSGLGLGLEIGESTFMVVSDCIHIKILWPP